MAGTFNSDSLIRYATACSRIKRVFDTLVTDVNDEKIYTKILERWQSKSFKLHKLSSKEQAQFRFIVNSHPVPVLKAWTKKCFMMQIKNRKSEDIFLTLLGRLGVDVSEEDASMLDEALKAESATIARTSIETNNDKLEFQASFVLKQGSIELYSSMKSKLFTLITKYEGLDVSVSKSSKFLWFELDLRDSTCFFVKKASNLSYEFLKRVNPDPKQKLVSLLYERSRNALPNAGTERLEVYVDPIAFVYYPDIIKNIRKDFQLKSIKDLKALVSLEKLNQFTTASKVGLIRMLD